VANGGTGAATLGTGNLVVGNATSAVTTLAPANNGQVVLVTAGTSVTAGAFVIGASYTITSVGTTSFTAIGASANTVGVSFVATGVGTGTGTATLNTFSTGSSVIASTLVATTSGTSIDFTSIPSWVKKITVMLNGVSTTGSSNIELQLGTSTSVETTGYLGVGSKLGSSSVSTTALDTNGFSIDTAASTIHSGTYTLTNIASNTWICVGNITRATNIFWVISGTKSVASTLDRIRLTTSSGTPTFSAGSMNIFYE
jgi:hypothetical protein